MIVLNIKRKLIELTHFLKKNHVFFIYFFLLFIIFCFCFFITYQKEVILEQHLLLIQNDQIIGFLKEFLKKKQDLEHQIRIVSQIEEETKTTFI